MRLSSLALARIKISAQHYYWPCRLSIVISKYQCKKSLDMSNCEISREPQRTYPGPKPILWPKSRPPVLGFIKLQDNFEFRHPPMQFISLSRVLWKYGGVESQSKCGNLRITMPTSLDFVSILQKLCWIGYYCQVQSFVAPFRVFRTEAGRLDS